MEDPLVSLATRANFAKLAEEFEQLLPSQRELERLLAEHTHGKAASARTAFAQTVGAVRETARPLPDGAATRRAARRGPDAWLRAGAPTRPLVADLAAAKRETRMANALEALLRLSEAESERQAERDHQASEREAESLRLARSNRRWAIVAGCTGLASIAATVLVATLAG